MNRETKRRLRRQGQLGEDGAPAAPRREAPARAVSRPAPGQRQKPGQFLKDVRGELRKVAWPTRGEVINYSSVVLFALVLLMLLIFALDFAFAKSILFLFET